MKISVIIPTVGRDTLGRAVSSVLPQLRSGDELLVEPDVDYRQFNPGGSRARNWAMKRATGDYLAFLDDDDTFLPAALDAIRDAADKTSNTVCIFQTRYPDGRIVPSAGWTPAAGLAECSVTPCIVTPRFTHMPEWVLHGATERRFLEACISASGVAPVFFPTIICAVRPSA